MGSELVITTFQGIQPCFHDHGAWKSRKTYLLTSCGLPEFLPLDS